MRFAKIISFCMAAIVLAVLTGCSSKKHASTGAQGYGSATTQRGGSGKISYADEPSDAMGRDLAAEARRWLGTPYRYGGQDRSGTDCSGLVMEVYREVCAVKLPRSSSSQMSYCTEVARNKARMGDLMFFGGSGKVSHVGLYIGNGEMIHASSSRGVMISNVDTGYWGQRLLGAGRVGGAQESWAKAGKGKNGKERPADEPTPQPRLNDIQEIQIASTGRPVPVAEIAYNRIPPATPELNADQSVSVRNLPDAAATAEAPTPSALDMLDRIINQKVDSIFADRFMD